MESKDLRSELESLQTMAQSAEQRLSDLRRRLNAAARDLASIRADLTPPAQPEMSPGQEETPQPPTQGD